MGRKLLLAIGLSLAVIGIGVTGCTGDLTFPEGQSAVTEGSIILSQQNTGIWVSGEGKVSLVPDVTILNLGVEAQKTTVAKAQAAAAEAMVEIMAVLDGYNIAEKDIKTHSFSIYPVWDWDNGESEIIGYRVSNMVTVKIRQMDDTGAIIDAVAEAGGDYTRINSISFTVDDPTAYYEEVREEAMADAKAKAEQLADLAEVSLGKPTYINEGSVFAPIYRDYYLAAEAAPGTPISPGETEISLTVQVVYNIG